MNNERYNKLYKETFNLFQFNSLKDSKEPVVFTYITYKDNSDILEESQKLKLAVMLVEYGCKVIIKERYYIAKIYKLYVFASIKWSII